MALINKIETNKGPVEYWVISLIQLDNFSRNGHLKMYGFFDKSYADKPNAQPIITLEMDIWEPLYSEYFDPDVLRQSGVGLYQQAYKLIKRSEIQYEDQMYDFSKVQDSIGD